MAVNARSLDAAIAVTRFGLGARPGEIETLRRKIRAAGCRRRSAETALTSLPASAYPLPDTSRYNSGAVHRRGQAGRCKAP